MQYYYHDSLQTWGPNATPLPNSLVAAGQWGCYPNIGYPEFFFSMMYKQLNDTKLIVCPADATRSPAPSWDLGLNSTAEASISGFVQNKFVPNSLDDPGVWCNYISYFAGGDATPTMPQSILAGDRNIYDVTDKTLNHSERALCLLGYE